MQNNGMKENKPCKGDWAMKRITVIILTLCVAVMLIIGTSDAQNKRIGTAAAPELLIPVGARDLAMGGSTISDTWGVEALHWNPAGLGRLSYSAEGLFSTMSYIADINVAYGAVGASFGNFGNVGLSIKSINFGDIPITTEDDPEGNAGRYFAPTYITTGLTYARGLTEAISVGVTVKIVSEQIDRVSASDVAFDVGVQYKNLVGLAGFDLGVVIKNIGPQMRFDGPGLYRNALSSDGRRPEQKYKSEAASFELPSLVEIGLSYGQMYQQNISWKVCGSFTNNNLYLDEYKIGGEAGYFIDKLKLFGRIGMGFVPQAETDEEIFGVTFGFGVTYNTMGVDISLDYAYRQVDYFNGNNIFALKLGF
jgi:hypothetical protein